MKVSLPKKPVQRIDKIEADLQRIRDQTEDLSRYVRAANAIERLLGRRSDPETVEASKLVAKAIRKIYELQVEELATAERTQLLNLYKRMTEPHVQ